MFMRFEKEKMQTLPRLIRSIHPLCWLLLLYLISGQAVSLYPLIVYGSPRGEVSEGSFITRSVIISLVAVIHIGIYGVAFRHQLSRRIQWLVLAT